MQWLRPVYLLEDSGLVRTLRGGKEERGRTKSRTRCRWERAAAEPKLGEEGEEAILPVCVMLLVLSRAGEGRMMVLTPRSGDLELVLLLAVHALLV